MNRKITDRALAGSGGNLGASGSIPPARSSSSCSSDASARPPKPQKASRMNSRRLGVRRTCGGRRDTSCSRNIQEPVEIEEGQRELSQWLLMKKRDREFSL